MQSEFIVLRKTPYRENALVLSGISPDFGKLEVIAYGVMHERTTTPFFFLLAYTHAMAAIQRGAGKSTVSMLVMAICWCVIRVPYVTIAAHLFPVLRSVSTGYPVTWALSSIAFTIYFFKTDWMHSYKAHA